LKMFPLRSEADPLTLRRPTRDPFIGDPFRPIHGDMNVLEIF
jgi:hypothetical protein